MVGNVREHEGKQRGLVELRVVSGFVHSYCGRLFLFIEGLET